MTPEQKSDLTLSAMLIFAFLGFIAISSGDLGPTRPTLWQRLFDYVVAHWPP